MSSTSVFFGNVSVKEFEDITKVNFTQEDKQWLESHRTNKAKGENGKFHIFRHPFQIHCCETIIDEVLTILYNYNFSKSERFGFVRNEVEE